MALWANEPQVCSLGRFYECNLDQNGPLGFDGLAKNRPGPRPNPPLPLLKFLPAKNFKTIYHQNDIHKTTLPFYGLGTTRNILMYLGNNAFYFLVLMIKPNSH